MNSNKKKILAIALVIVIVLLGGAAVYVATQLSTRQAVAPNAPESEPMAFEPCGSGLDCSTTQTTGTTQCTDAGHPSGWWCCPSGLSLTQGACRKMVTSDACTATGSATAVTEEWSVKKEAFLNVSSNTPGIYDYKTKKTGNTAIVSPGETYVYMMWFTNDTGATISGMTLKDTLIEDNLDKLTFVDSSNDCNYETSTKTVTCADMTVRPGTWGKGFRVTVADDIADGTVIKNTVLATYKGETKEGVNSLTAKVVEIKKAELEGSKTAYKNESGNTPGKYTLTTEIDSVSKSQIYVYTISLTNISETTASGVVLKDSLKDMPVTYMDAVSGCTWSATDVQLTCNGSINPDETKEFSFRVKATDAVANGTTITNVGKVTYPDGSFDVTKDLNVSSVVSCNHTCTTDEECTSPLTCDAETNKCRKPECATEDDCTCAVVATGTIAPTATRAPVVTRAATPTVEAEVTATPTVLPETGILDFPGVAAFGGGLFLAIIGILLAL